jgi:hypothetical protein
MTFQITLMPDFITQIGTWLVITTAVVFGAVAIYGLFDKRKREVRGEENAVEDRLIVLFKEERAQLDKRLNEQDAVIAELEVKVDKMTHENELLIKVLQGKDEASQKYQADAYATMAKIDVLLDLAKLNNENITKLVALIDRRFMDRRSDEPRTK